MDRRSGTGQGNGAQQVLLVGDRDPFAREALRRALGAMFALVFVERGEEVLEEARRLRPAVVVLEALLPGMDGFQVCLQLKRDPHTRCLPVLFLTLLSARERAAQVGADAFLMKPARREALLQTLQNLLTEHPEPKEGSK